MKKAVVAGMIASYPVGGVAWDYAQYLLGLAALGFEVMYLEDTGCQTFHPETGEDDVDYSVRFLNESLSALSPPLGRRWHFRAALVKPPTPSSINWGKALCSSRSQSLPTTSTASALKFGCSSANTNSQLLLKKQRS